MTARAAGGRDRDGRANPGTSGGAYGLGFIGALVYRIQEADGFWEGAYGVFQALVWPAFLVYDLLDHLGA